MTGEPRNKIFVILYGLLYTVIVVRYKAKYKFITILLIIVLSVITLAAVFSVNAMEYGKDHKCPISIASSPECPPSSDAMGFMEHHISGIASFSLAIVGGLFNNIFALLFFAAFAVLAVFYARDILSIFLANTSLSYWRKRRRQRFSKYSLQLIRWLAVRRKLDPNALLWVRAKV